MLLISVIGLALRIDILIAMSIAAFLPISVAMLVVFFAAMFTLSYPVDGMVSTNTRYILSSSAPMAACLGIGLGEIERPLLRRFLTLVTGVAVALIAVLYTYTRWGI